MEWLKVSVNKSLKERIYQAQCLGNVEPIEYMAPYPNLGAIVDGMIIKHSDKQLFGDRGWTRMDFHRRVKQTANWLSSRGVKPKERVLISSFPFPDAESLAFAIWTVGASLVISNESDFSLAGEKTNPSFSILKNPFPNCLEGKPDKFNSTYNPLLEDEALVFLTTGKGIRLNHYNLLINASGVEKALNLEDYMTLHCDLSADSTAWAVLQAILPLYFGGTFTEDNPDVNLTSDYKVVFDLANLDSGDPKEIMILPENTAVLAVGQEPIHMTRYKSEEGFLKVEGHSVMMGYLDESLNDAHFRDGFFHLRLSS